MQTGSDGGHCDHDRERQLAPVERRRPADLASSRSTTSGQSFNAYHLSLLPLFYLTLLVSWPVHGEFYNL